MQMPHNGFDSLAALARLNYDDTSHHRERWPSLDWVWDELDMLRECWVTAIDHDDHEAALYERDALSEAALYERDSASRSTYSWPLRVVPFLVFGVTNTTAR